MYHASLLRYVEGLAKNNTETEEIVQEGFVLLYLHKDKIRSAEGIYPYLFTIVKRLVISHFRRKMTSVKYLEDLRNHWTESNESVADFVAEQELWQSLQDSIEALPLRQRQVYWMNKFEHKSYQEIADDLGLSRSTVKNQIIAATKIIRLKLSKYHLLIFFFFFH